MLSLQRSVDNAALLPQHALGCSHVFRKRPQGVAQTLSAAEQGEAERLCDGCPCVGAKEICGAPSPTYPCMNEGERRLPSQLASQPANQPSTKELNGASVRRVPLRRREGNMWRALAHLPLYERGRAPPSKPTSKPASKPTQHKGTKRSIPPAPKKGQTFNLRSHTQFCYREKVVLPACASLFPGAVPPHPRLVEPQAPLHAHHAERKTKTNVFEVD